MARARGKGSLIISARLQRERALMQFLKNKNKYIWLQSTKKSII
jgi:hypothetical protein